MATIKLPASLNVGAFDFEVECEVSFTTISEQGDIEVSEVRINNEPVLLSESQFDQIAEELQLTIA